MVPDKADLKVALSVPARAVDGARVTETVTVTNKGPAAAIKVVTALTKADGLTVTNADGARVTGPVLTWSTASLAPGSSLTFTVTVQVGAHAHGTVLLAAGALSAPRIRTCSTTPRSPRCVSASHGTDQAGPASTGPAWRQMPTGQ